MELFHQTVSMKSVGNLTDFVREHMLEPFDAAEAVPGHRRPLRSPHQRARGGPARPGPARALTPAARRNSTPTTPRTRIARPRPPSATRCRTTSPTSRPGSGRAAHQAPGRTATSLPPSRPQLTTRCAKRSGSRRPTCRSSAQGTAATSSPTSSGRSATAGRSATPGVRALWPSATCCGRQGLDPVETSGALRRPPRQSTAAARARQTPSSRTPERPHRRHASPSGNSTSKAEEVNRELLSLRSAQEQHPSAELDLRQACAAELQDRTRTTCRSPAS